MTRARTIHNSLDNQIQNIVDENMSRFIPGKLYRYEGFICNDLGVLESNGVAMYIGPKTLEISEQDWINGYRTWFSESRHDRRNDGTYLVYGAEFLIEDKVEFICEAHLDYIVGADALKEPWYIVPLGWLILLIIFVLSEVLLWLMN